MNDAATVANERLHKEVGDDLDLLIDEWRAWLAQAPNVDPIQQWIHLRDLIFKGPSGDFDIFEAGHLLAMAIDRLARQPKGTK
jgi:hypothetical protein